MADQDEILLDMICRLENELRLARVDVTKYKSLVGGAFTAALCSLFIAATAAATCYYEGWGSAVRDKCVSWCARSSTVDEYTACLAVCKEID